MHDPTFPAVARRRLGIGALALLLVALFLAACGAEASPSPILNLTLPSAGEPASPTAPPASLQPAAPSPTPAPETGGGTTSGDIPDNAVFLTYHSTNPVFSIQYVEGWQVTPQPDGVVVRDKDSSETVSIRAATSDVAGYVATTDLPALAATAGFKLIKQDTVKVGSSTYVHLVYHLPAPPDPVTGKQVPSTVDRYYVPGPAGLAVISLSTPDGVDNVDAFRQMIGSFRWP